jgi:hypothetical protein
VIDLSDREVRADHVSALGFLRGRGVDALAEIKSAIDDAALHELLGALPLDRATPDELFRARVRLEGVREGTAAMLDYVSSLVVEPAD